MFFGANFRSCSSVGKRISHVTKFLLQKLRYGMLVVFNSTSKVSILSPANLLVLRSMTMGDSV